jgi:beta-N-acetylhexosaminidase
MSAHIVAPAIDDDPATISRKVMTGLLREELGFEGVAVSDGLDMAGLSRDRGVPQSAVLALIAGCDALCVGGGPTGEDAVDEIVAAIAAAVRDGRLTEDRLGQAAARVDALAAWRAGRHGAMAPPHEVGITAARRAIRYEGPVQARNLALVVRFTSAPSMAAGEVPWGMADALSARGVRVEARDAAAGAEHPTVPAGCSLVLVVRDLHRHPDHRISVETLLAHSPAAVTVEMGVPEYRPRGAGAYIATYGSARVCAQAAAEVMRP